MPAAAAAAAEDVEVSSDMARAPLLLLLLLLLSLLLISLLSVASRCMAAMLLVEGATGAEVRDHRATCASMHSSSSTSGSGASCSRYTNDDEDEDEDWGEVTCSFGAQGDVAPRKGRRAPVYGLIVGLLGREKIE